MKENNPLEDIPMENQVSTVDSESISGHVIENDKQEQGKEEEESTLVSGRKLALIFSAFMTAFSLVALDQTILSTALPTIASHFQAVTDLTWIASAYFLPQAALMLFFGRLTAIAPAKIIFLTSVAIFELGSLFCAVAPSVRFLIFGRAVAGVGGAGMWVSILAVIARITTMSQRPVLMGLFGAVFAVASIVGPLLGGVFADHVSWRWCFYINLPLGAIGFTAILFLLPNHRPVAHSSPSSPTGSQSKPTISTARWYTPYLHLDWIGTILSLGMIVALLLPLQWGGNVKSWNDGGVIACFVVFGVLLAAFLTWEWRIGTRAIFPVQMVLRRSMAGAIIEAAVIQIGFVIASYYLPLLYQLRGHSATRSGIDILPFMFSGVLATLIAGGVVSSKGYVWPFLFFMPMVASVGFGLLFTVNETTSFGRIAGFQILVGAGLGSAIQNTIIVAQAEFADNEALIPQATSMITFMQLIGSSVGLAASEAVFSSQLKASLRLLASSLPPEVIQAILASVAAVEELPPDVKEAAVKAYIRAVDRVFLIGVPATALGGIAAVLIRRRRIEKPGVAAAM